MSCNVWTPDVCHYMQAWVSPWQVAHVLSIISTIEDNMPEVDPLLPEQPGAQQQPAQGPASRSTSSAQPLNTQLRVTLTADIPILNVLCLVRPGGLSSCLGCPRNPL